MVESRENPRYYFQQPRLLAENLVDSVNVSVRRLGLDLLADFQQFVHTVRDYKHLANSSPVIILSPLASAMVRKFSERSNQLRQELSFSLRCVKLLGENHEMFVVAHAVQAMNFAQAQRTYVSVDPSIEMFNATEIAKQTNLIRYFEQNTNKSRGEVAGIGHVHHTSLD